MLRNDFKIAIFLQTLYLFIGFASGQSLFSGLKCRKEYQTFEIYTGFIHVSPSDTIATIPDSLHLADCLSKCRRNSACLSVNYETGLCILFNSSALTRTNTLSPSNFPVFTIYAQKICYTINVNSVCRHREWAFETVKGYQLANPSFVLRKIDKLSNRIECMERCLLESEFTCRSVNFYNGTCEMMENNRHSIASNFHFEKYFIKTNRSVEYIESNCVEEPSAMCFFKRVRNKMLKTVDSLYEQIKDEEQCKQLCLNANIRCHSYTLGDKNNKACRISHLSTNSLSHIVEPYMVTPGVDTYELSACYNVTVSCDSKDMTAHVLTNRLFSGKVYGKGKPKSCVNDVQSSLNFNLTMPYNDINCEVQQANFSRYHKDIVIQHHDLIVTTKDIGLSVHCSYDLTNRTVMNSIRFEEDIEGKDADDRLIHSSFVYSPNVTIQIKDVFGQDVRIARVGDTLTLRFAIDDENTPYEIMIRDLVASDGTDNDNQITLIDSNGCPTDVSIMGSINKRMIRRNEDKSGTKSRLRDDDRKGGANNLEDNLDSNNNSSSSRKSVVDKFKSAKLAATAANEYEFSLNTKQLETVFEAFKFSTTDTVQFKAVVTPCLGTCAPANCVTENPDGTTFTLNSFGRRRRRSIMGQNDLNDKMQRTNDRKLDKSNEDEAVIVVQSIKITDNFAFNKENESPMKDSNELKNIEYDLEKIGLKGSKSNTIFNCLSTTTIALLILVLAIIQIGFIVFWIYFKQAIKSTKSKQWWKQNSSFDDQIDSVRYSNSHYCSNPSSFYSNSRQTSIGNQKI